jgi:hypothetical protein
MADWKVASVRQVFTTTDSRYAMVLLNEGGQQDTWRRIEPRTIDGCSNILQIATGAWIRDHDLVIYLLNNAGEITAIANFFI